MGLNDAFNIVRSQILSIELLLNISKAYALVIREEKQLLFHSNCSPTVEGAAFSSMANSVSDLHIRLRKM
ncbi:hypothetical protein DITRI_Ditri09bG0089200 [Diplodiscus trichospermus]